MKKIKIGVLCPSEIAFRRFMPALQKNDNFEFAGISYASSEEWTGTLSEELIQTEQIKAQNFIDSYGGILFHSYSELLDSMEIDAVYIPLPPALHFKWAKKALENGKHVLLEKPFTTSLYDTNTLIEIAEAKKLAIHENYMFEYHSQIEWIKSMLADGIIGDVRLIRIDFGFPFRGANDFRYNKSLGGGALFDCGGYTLKLVGMFLGKSAHIIASRLNYKEGFEVNIYGSAVLVNADGLTAQVSFGMDNDYRCNLDIWGSTGSLFTDRILTAPVDFEPTVIIKNNKGEQKFILPSDDTFYKSIEFFGGCITDEKSRMAHYESIRKQSELVSTFKETENHNE